jgi:cyclin-dependent kinase 2
MPEPVAAKREPTAQFLNAQSRIMPEPVGAERYLRLTWQGTLKVLGEGTYGKVFAGWDVVGQLQVALKASRDREGAMSREKIFFDVIAGTHVPTPNLLKMYDAFAHNGSLVLVFEYMRASLDDEFKRASGWLDFELCEDYSAQLFSALTQLHGLSIVHADVKLSNCLLDARTRTLKLADLGISTHAMDLVYKGSMVTIPYRSPELFLLSAEAKPPIDKTPCFNPVAVDIWAGVVVVITLFIGVVIFNAYTKDARKDLWPRETFMQQVSLLGNSGRVSRAGRIAQV